MDTLTFLLYLLVMAGVTYLVRMLPMVLCQRKIENKFVCSFLYYIPYAVLSAMTIPAIFTSTSFTLSAIIGFAVALILAFFERNLLIVAGGACVSVLITELIMGAMGV